MFLLFILIARSKATGYSCRQCVFAKYAFYSTFSMCWIRIRKAYTRLSGKKVSGKGNTIQAIVLIIFYAGQPGLMLGSILGKAGVFRTKSTLEIRNLLISLVRPTGMTRAFLALALRAPFGRPKRLSCRFVEPTGSLLPPGGQTKRATLWVTLFIWYARQESNL